jgi:hypothetical protein
VWRKIKVRPADGFETAETQNIGKHLYNSVTDNDKVEGEKPAKINETPVTTIKPTELPEIITTIMPTIEETKTSMFDDARKAFEEFLSIEEDADDAANMEEEDEKLEKEIISLTTTTQIPTTEEPITSTTTNLPPTTTFSTIEVETTSKPIISKKEEKKQVKTSTKQKVTGEICFRGKCIKTQE